LLATSRMLFSSKIGSRRLVAKTWTCSTFGNLLKVRATNRRSVARVDELLLVAATCWTSINIHECLVTHDVTFDVIMANWAYGDSSPWTRTSGLVLDAAICSAEIRFNITMQQVPATLEISSKWHW
jgi:hypothetical protein